MHNLNLFRTINNTVSVNSFFFGNVTSPTLLLYLGLGPAKVNQQSSDLFWTNKISHLHPALTVRQSEISQQRLCGTWQHRCICNLRIIGTNTTLFG